MCLVLDLLDNDRILYWSRVFAAYEFVELSD